MKSKHLIQSIFLILLVSQVFSVSTLIGKFRSKSRKSSYQSNKLQLEAVLPGQPSHFPDQPYQESGSPGCTDRTKCRSWGEMKDVSYCKASKLAGMLPGDKDIYQARIDYKTEAQGEYAKFLYAELEKSKFSSDKITGGAVFLRICVPVSVDENAYIDYKCPFDECGKYNPTSGCQRKLSDEFATVADKAIENNIEAGKLRGTIIDKDNMKTQ